MYSLNVSESVATGTELVHVETIDKDGPENSNVTYSFVDNPDNAFSIQSVTGRIYVAGTLDREIRYFSFLNSYFTFIDLKKLVFYLFRDEYSLKVQADDGAWKLETIITVTLVRKGLIFFFIKTRN